MQYIDMSQERTIAFGLLLIVGLLFGSLFGINLIDFFFVLHSHSVEVVDNSLSHSLNPYIGIV